MKCEMRYCPNRSEKRVYWPEDRQVEQMEEMPRTVCLCRQHSIKAQEIGDLMGLNTYVEEVVEEEKK